MRSLLSASLVMVGGVCINAQAALPAGLSGGWFNPQASGHGLSVQILDPERALVFWYVYDHEGKPFNLYIEGRIAGHRIDGVAYAPKGMRWGSFDPADLQMPVWGEVGLEFSDCDTATLSWEADSPDFGSGSMGVTRLSGIHALECRFPSASALPPGAYSLLASKERSGIVTEQAGIAAVDPQGAVWAAEFLASDPRDIPGPTYVGASMPRALSAIPSAEDAASIRLGNNTWAMAAWASAYPGGVETLTGTWSVDTDNATLSFASAVHDSNETWIFSAAPGTLVAPLTTERLAGDYSVRFRGQFSLNEQTLRINADGTLCIAASTEEPCRYAGRYWLPDGELGFMDFEVSDSTDPAQIHRGRGFLHAGDEGQSLHMIGDNGTHGFALHAR